MLFALTTASRASEITHLDVRSMVKSPLFYCFTLTKPTKVMFKGFEDNKNKNVLCKALEDYLEKTASLRDGETIPLIATIKPHKKLAA